MGEIILVIGGARSGKSSYAEQAMAPYKGQVTYVATAQVTDEDMAARVAHHRARRPESWQTIEAYKDLPKVLEDQVRPGTKGLMLECMTTMITNLMFDITWDYDQLSQEEIGAIEKTIEQAIDELIVYLKAQPYTSLIITNEVGLGLVASYRLGNIFRDIAGRMNQKLGACADQVIMTVAGIPVTIK